MTGIARFPDETESDYQARVASLAAIDDAQSNHELGAAGPVPAEQPEGRGIRSGQGDARRSSPLGAALVPSGPAGSESPLPCSRITVDTVAEALRRSHHPSPPDLAGLSRISKHKISSQLSSK